jgi:predicted ester cyclase
LPVQDNKQAVRRFYQDVLNSRELDAIQELVVPYGLDHTFAPERRTGQAIPWAAVHAIPDLHVQVHEVIAKGALVAIWATYSGIHQGEFVGIPATGEHTTVHGVDWFRMEVAGRPSAGAGPDMLSFLVQLDLLPGPGTPNQARPPSGGPMPVTAARLGQDASGPAIQPWATLPVRS